MENFWKDKRVVAYIALKHHTRFITPVLDAIKAQGAQIEYLVAQAERSQEITAIETGIPYSHIFDFIDKSDQEEIFENYKIMRKTFAKAMLKDPIFNLQMLTVLDKTLFATAQEYVGFKNYLTRNKPDLILVLHELNRWGKVFAFQAKKKNIPFLTFQEGLYTTATSYYNFTMTGHAQYSSLNLVWGRQTKKLLAEYEAPEDKISIVGNTHLIDEIKRTQTQDIRKIKREQFSCRDKLAVLLMFSIQIKPFEELMPLFEFFKNQKERMLFVKFHPGTLKMTIEKWIDQIPKDLKKNIHFIHAEENTYDLMALSDLCLLTEASTAGLEALAFGKTIIELDLPSPNQFDFSLAKEKAALKMTPDALVNALNSSTDFTAAVDPEKIKNYISRELSDTKNAIQNVIEIMQQAIMFNQSLPPKPLNSLETESMDWTIVLPCIEDAQTFLTILEAVANHSNEELFELIIIKPAQTDPQIQQILDSLEGDISILETAPGENLSHAFNTAASKAKGKYLAFLDDNLAPQKGWLSAIKKEIPNYNSNTIFGGKIFSRFNNIVHAGMVTDANNYPVSAYAHLDKDFPKACIKRSFQMVNYFVAMEKQAFLSMGGFEKLAGRYCFMDLSLRACTMHPEKKGVIYLPDVELVQTRSVSTDMQEKDAIFFYTRWHGTLWENETDLYHSDGVSALQLNAARMTRAMETASLL